MRRAFESSVRLTQLFHVALRLVLLVVACERHALAQATVARASTATNTKPKTASLWRAEWPQFSGTEAVLTTAATLGTAAIVLIGPLAHPRWEGPILFDGAVRSELRGHSAETRAHFRTVGNYTYHLSPVIPLLDVFVVSTIGHGDSRLALNLGLITAEAFSYTGLSAFVSTELSARARPDSPCQRGDCSGDTQSFFSGHAAISATAAGLVCANHSRIALYGSAWADAAICALSATNALATATTRVVADRHYASDVIVGTGIGFGIGYAVPVLLHYSDRGASLALGPDLMCGANCIAVSGTF